MPTFGLRSKSPSLRAGIHSRQSRFGGWHKPSAAMTGWQDEPVVLAVRLRTAAVR
jgi:hypothetical protein